MSHAPNTPQSPSEPPREPASSPWRQPVVWLVIALVAAAVAGSIALLVIASGDGSTDAMPDPVRRTAQVQTADLGPDAVAAGRKLSAIVRVDAEQGFVEALPVGGDFDRAAPLRLELLHPTLGEHDRALELAPTDTGWRAEAELDGSHDWNLRLGDIDGQWRLQGRLPAGQQAASVRPALQAP
ncbi:FixH family protein [Novilysobacter arseniciresistens]|uniref:FixH family protein n=1 Tax=Novilysobacter arseniciresistens TaxID=1385522 RepID=UPI00068A75A8|nr:FixH family protein [Lysobacter arseniciresistens]